MAGSQLADIRVGRRDPRARFHQYGHLGTPGRRTSGSTTTWIWWTGPRRRAWRAPARPTAAGRRRGGPDAIGQSAGCASCTTCSRRARCPVGRTPSARSWPASTRPRDRRSRLTLRPGGEVGLGLETSRETSSGPPLHPIAWAAAQLLTSEERHPETLRRRRLRLAVSRPQPEPRPALVRHEGLREQCQGPPLLPPEGAAAAMTCAGAGFPA